jgi:hypothetical protein
MRYSSMLRYVESHLILQEVSSEPSSLHIRLQASSSGSEYIGLQVIRSALAPAMNFSGKFKQDGWLASTTAIAI